MNSRNWNIIFQFNFAKFVLIYLYFCTFLSHFKNVSSKKLTRNDLCEISWNWLTKIATENAIWSFKNITLSEPMLDKKRTWKIRAKILLCARVLTHLMRTDHNNHSLNDQMAKIGNEPIDFSITAQSVPIVTNLYCHMINAAIIFFVCNCWKSFPCRK